MEKIFDKVRRTLVVIVGLQSPHRDMLPSPTNIKLASVITCNSYQYMLLILRELYERSCSKFKLK